MWISLLLGSTTGFEMGSWQRSIGGFDCSITAASCWASTPHRKCRPISGLTALSKYDRILRLSPTTRR